MVNIRGYTRGFAQQGLTGLQMSSVMRNSLFASPNFDQQNKIDLAATNIKRGEYSVLSIQKSPNTLT